MDLFTPVVPAGLLHPNFHRITQLNNPYELAVLSRWADGFVDRDNKFVKEFQTTFNPSFWELYLHACFKELGLLPNFTHPTPDFWLNGHGLDFTAEAVTASNPQGYRPEWERDVRPESLAKIDIREVVHLASIRIANALTSKHARYRDHYAKLLHVTGKPFVLCIGPFEQPFFYLQNDNAIRRVLYGFDQYIHYDDPETGERRISGVALTPEVDKDSGARVPTGLFTHAGTKEISAVIFSNTSGWCKVKALAGDPDAQTLFSAMRYNATGLSPHTLVLWNDEYKETLLDGMHLLLNPFAEHPLDVSPFRNREITIHSYNVEQRQYLTDAPDGFLIQRICNSFHTGLRKSRPAPAPAVTNAVYRESHRPPWPDGQLRAGMGEIPPFIQNHMAHYQGWTIVVVRDAIDDDWMAQALQGTFFSIPEYLNGNQDEDRKLILAPESYTAKQDAMAAIQGMIDQAEISS